MTEISDPLVYIIGFGHDDLPLWYQCKKMDEYVEDILEYTGAVKWSMYLTGKGNFREEVATIQPYKGNRDVSHKPKKYKELRNYLVHVWNAKMIEGMEADDACGMDCYKSRDNGYIPIVCSIDKDLKMLEGTFYDYKRKELLQTSEVEAWRFFYTQILTGDPSDNIPGLFKTTGTRATKKLKEGLLGLSDPAEMEKYVKETYLEAGATIEMFYEIGSLLWIARGTEDDLKWHKRKHTSPIFTLEVLKS